MRGAQTLISVKWLAQQISANVKDMRVVDTSWHLPTTKRDARSEFRDKHIPGSVFFDIDTCSDENAPLSHMLPPANKFEDYIGNLGVGNDTHVVLYDNSDKFAVFSAPRVWWMFRVFGHDLVSILDGGFQKWRAEGQPVDSVTLEVPHKRFTAIYRPGLVKSFEDIYMNVQDKHDQVLDARSAGRFNGTDLEPRKDIKPGHIPGSINTPFMDITDHDTKLVKSPEQLRKWFASKAVDLDKDMVATCGSGVTACSVALAAYICGKQDVPVYDGSWMEWYQRAPDDFKASVPD